VKIAARLLGQAAKGGLAHQIVRESRAAACLESDSAADEIVERGLDALGRPLEEHSRVGDGQRTPRDGQQSQHCGGI
jgi:hypothetical protein